MVVLKIKKNYTIFQLGILIMCFKTALRHSAIIPYTDFADSALTVIAVLCLCIAILRKRYTVKMLWFYGCITLLSFLSVLQTKNYGFLITIIVCLAMRGENLDEFLNSMFKYELFFMIVHTCIAFIFAAVGHMPLYMIISGKKRYCFGFTHPNFFSVYFFNLLILWSWINYNRVQLKQILVMFVLSVVMLSLTKTRTSFITTTAFCILIIIAKSKFSFKKFLNPIAEFIFPLSAAFTLVSAKLYLMGRPIVVMLDLLLSKRIMLNAYSISTYGFSLLGQKIDTYKVDWNSEWNLNQFAFDNLYAFLSVHQGFIWIVILSVLYYFLAKKKDLKTNIFIIAWALYGITETQGINGFVCFPIFLLVLLFNQNKTTIQEGKCSKL